MQTANYSRPANEYFQSVKHKAMQPKKISEEMVLDGKIQVEKAEFGSEGGNYERYRVLRQDASVILLHDKERQKVILISQFRYPVSEKSSENILEIVAGKVDEGETPQQAALREIEEETGYVVPAEQLKFLTSAYVSPGYSTERFHFFYAEVTSGNKTAKGGGMEEENESIDLVELPVADFLKQVKDGTINDAKTILAALWCEQLLSAAGHVEVKGY